METKDESFWACVELLGHKRYAGRLSEQVISGCGFVRVDVPGLDGLQPFTKIIGTGSIYAITPISEALAKELTRQYREKPVDVYSPTVQPAITFGEDAEY